MNKVFTFSLLDNYGGVLYRLNDFATPQTSNLLSDFLNEDNEDILDTEYHVGHSDEKFLSPYFTKMVLYALKENDFTIEELLNDELDANDLNDVLSTIFVTNDGFDLAHNIYVKFAFKWKKLWDALTTNYNPLENYSMTETRTPNITKTDTFNTTDTRTPNLTNTENGTFNKQVDSENSLYGFNSSNKNPANASTGDESNSIVDHTNVETGTDTNSKTGNITNTETGTETLTRSGNIGVTTSQQMLESEFEVRKHDFYEMMFNDIDSILCLKSY